MFRYNEVVQAVPLVHGKKMICVTSRGGDYSAGTYMNSYDHQEPYLRAIFGFIGITDLEFISAQPMDVTPELREIAVQGAMNDAAALASRPDWAEATADRLLVHPPGLKPQPIVDSGVGTVAS
jgi:FMN-dependent NADH-azoreductase